ncbi:hypothetical protein Tco_0603738 [Tanacetum coccineum]
MEYPHLKNDIESNDYDDDMQYRLTDMWIHLGPLMHIIPTCMWNGKEVEKTPPKDPKANDSKPPDLEKDPIYNNDDVTS